MIYFEFYSFVIPKMLLAYKYEGGIEQFKLDIPNNSFLEDEYLASARFLKIDQLDQFLEFVKDKGLHYDKEQNYSEDFAVMSWIGPWWQSDWLVTNHFQCALKG